MSSVKVSFGKALDTVNSASTAIISTLDSVTDSVGMLNTRIRAEAVKQRKAVKVELASYDQTLAEQSAMERAQATLDTEKFKSQSPEHRKLFDEYQKQLIELLKED